MRIAIITMWYNEEALAPLFFKHYAQCADAIYVIIDNDTDDNTLNICSDFGAIMIPHEFTDGMDDRVKIKKFNELRRKLSHDYVIALDADEFIHEPRQLRKYLEKYRPDYQCVAFHQMYQHKSEKPINATDPVFKQRRHGDPDLTGWNKFYVKPCIVKNGFPATWEPGCHTLVFRGSGVEGQIWKGAHWHMTDVELAVKRRLAIRERQSQANIKGNLTAHNHHITESAIRSICKEHENDPKLF